MSAQSETSVPIPDPQLSTDGGTGIGRNLAGGSVRRFWGFRSIGSFGGLGGVDTGDAASVGRGERRI